MVKLNLCEIVQKELQHDRTFCLYPLRHHNGLTQACTISLPRGVNINLKFFSDKYNIQVWIGKDIINYQPGNTMKDCFFVKDFMRHLLRYNQEAAIIFIYSLFFKALKRIRDADAAYDAAYDAAADADAADAAADAAYDAAAAYAAYDAADNADAAYDAAAAASYAYDAADNAAYGKMKDAFKYLIKWRKSL